MRIQHLPLSKLEQNTGQIEGLPANPREWTQTDIDRLAISLKETPELFEARPIVVYPLGDKYIILAGNLRYSASRQNKAKTVPCVVLPDNLPVRKLGEIVLKDNGEFGSWNAGLLFLEWKDLPLESWGIEVPELQDYSGKNKEVDVTGFSENIVLKLKYEEPAATLVKTKLGPDPKATILSALHYGN